MGRKTLSGRRVWGEKHSQVRSVETETLSGRSVKTETLSGRGVRGKKHSGREVWRQKHSQVGECGERLSLTIINHILSQMPFMFLLLILLSLSQEVALLVLCVCLCFCVFVCVSVYHCINHEPKRASLCFPPRYFVCVCVF